ncbi:MAG: tandem-95 repeat protein [Deltaproteobacteria bacterium]|nr:tandem-95 repeat protein [Deltaproteobacteria bacterium]
MRTALLLALLPGLTAAAPAALSPEVAAAAARQPDHALPVVVHLRDGADLSRLAGLPRGTRRREAVRALREHAGRRQGAVLRLLEARRGEGRAGAARPLWVINGLSVTATPEVIAELARHPDVAAVTPDEIDVVPTAAPTGPPEPNLTAVHAPGLWADGVTGQGVVVATLDSGADATHPDLSGRWRGPSGGWFDPYGQHASPVDLTGHGTWTLGVLVGGDAGGTAIGVAPDATWMAARIWNDSGSATATAIHLAFQWLLDPDGDPATDDAPDVVNGSFAFGSPGCNLEFQSDVRALAAAGIPVVFAAGNFGPGGSTSVSPANYPESIAVGSASNTGLVAGDSSRGPSACGGGVYPTVVAPGLYVNTADRFGLYTAVSGTSIAAPHVAGALALLRSAFPAATVADLRAALTGSARDLGTAGPDTASGYGFLDALAARDRLAAPPPPAPPTAADDAFSLPGDTSAAFAAPGVLANDGDPAGLPLSAVLVSGTAHGLLSLQPDGGFSYTPDAGFAGADAFTYQASNGSALSAAATATLTVTPPPAPPSAAPDAYAGAEDSALAVAAPGVLANDSDPAGRSLGAVLVSGPAHGTLTLSADGSFTYRPAANWNSSDAFSYQAWNGLAASAAATVTLTVAPVNDPPVAADDVASTARNTSVVIRVVANDTDVDGTVAPATVTIVTAPRYGKATARSDGTVLYTPARRFSGTDSFRYTVRDDLGAVSAAATVRVTVR